MNEQEKQAYVKHIISIISKANGLTYDQLQKNIDDLNMAIISQRSYIGVGPFDNDSKLVDEIFSVFTEHPIGVSKALEIIEQVSKEVSQKVGQAPLVWS